MSFVHLHLHTAYSLLDGFSDIKKLMKRVSELNMPAVALTDHGTMFGAVEFYNAAKANNVKPIIGLEAYMAARTMNDREKPDKHSSHLLLLAENDTGYRNLLAIASAAQLNGFYYFPRIDHDFLAAHSEGLIATSGCMAAEIPRAIMNEGLESARKKLDWYYDLFGPDRFFIELQQHDIKELPGINRALMELGPRYQAKYVATNDVHYIKPEDARLQDILLAIQTGSLLSDDTRFKMSDTSYYLRTPTEMETLFAEVPEALANTLLIAERCNVDLSFKGYHLPQFTVPEGCTTETYLRTLCEQGMERRYGERTADPKVIERLNYELGVIHQMGFDAYFLIVWDMCRHAREQGIWYNARGSAAGSMVAYCLDITVVEPINHDLIFERFLNPGRISMPDIDMDFQDDRRAQMMEYTAQKYGDDKVAQIITFGTLGARAALRDVARVMDISLPEVDRIAKLIPNNPGHPMSLAEAVKETPELQQVYNDPSRPQIKTLLDTAAKMEGAVRNAGTHAAGVVITDVPVVEYVPLHRPTSNAEETPIKIVTQFEMSILEGLGLLKVDFLGLATLTIMQRACLLIQSRHGIDLNLNNIPTDDPDTFEFISKGHTAGVFQLEGNGMTRYITQMHPKTLANVIAMVALYRPGPLEFIPQYIRRMHGEEETTFRHPSLRPIFEETYGIPIYQEQIMRAAVDLAGYTLSESDELRKAIAKKQKEKLQKHREKFIHGAIERGIEQATAAGIFDDWEEFARYGFNKSHAADYGVIAVQTAYLKAHYTVEYMTALLSASKNDSDKVAFYVADARAMGIDVLPPDVNISGWDFTIEDRPEQKPAIRFGMGAVKNVGAGPVDLIIQARQDGPFEDLTGFAKQVDLRLVGRRALESLVRVGALDRFGPRIALLESLDRIIAVSTSHFKALLSGQMTFFGGAVGLSETIELPETGKLNLREMLTWERDLLGLYVSDHPLGPYMSTIRRKISRFSSALPDTRDKAPVTVAGMLTKFRPHATKTGKAMGFATLEDIQGNIELVLFPAVWEKFNRLIQVDKVLLVDGKLDNAGGDPKVLVDRIEELVLEDMTADEQRYTAVLQPADYSAEPLPSLANISLNDDVPWLDAADLPDLAAADGESELEASEPAAEAAEVDTAAQAETVALLHESLPPPLFDLPTPVIVAEPQMPLEGGLPGGNVHSASGGGDLPPQPPDLFWDDDVPTDGDSADVFIPVPAALGQAAARPAPALVSEKPAVYQPEQPVPAAAQPTPAEKPSPVEKPAAKAPVAAEPPAPARGATSFNLPPSLRATLQTPDDDEIRMVTITLRGSGDKERDVRRLRNIYGVLVSSPGRDRFAFQLHEGARMFSLEFPNNTTGLTPELIEKLVTILGEENLRVEMIRIQ